MHKIQGPPSRFPAARAMLLSLGWASESSAEFVKARGARSIPELLEKNVLVAMGRKGQNLTICIFPLDFRRF